MSERPFVVDLARPESVTSRLVEAERELLLAARGVLKAQTDLDEWQVMVERLREASLSEDEE